MKTVAVIGLGQVGTAVVDALLKEQNANVVIVMRAPRGEEQAFVERGATVKYCGSYEDLDKITEILRGVDVVLVAVRFSIELATKIEYILLEAARAAGVEVFCPCEFGQNSLWVNRGASTLFDAKKNFGEALVNQSDMKWIMFYTGCFMHYHLPRFAWGNKALSTFGNLDKGKRCPMTHLDDIGALIAKCLLDDRAINKCIQFDYRRYSQNEMLSLLRQNFPGRDFQIDNNSDEFIIEQKEHGSDTAISAAGGHEADRERHGINYVLWVDEKETFAPYDDTTLNVVDLYPSHTFRTVEEVLSSQEFVFGDVSIDSVTL